jgi:outer membrane protein insertion porin family
MNILARLSAQSETMIGQSYSGVQASGKKIATRPFKAWMNTPGNRIKVFLSATFLLLLPIGVSAQVSQTASPLALPIEPPGTASVTTQQFRLGKLTISGNTRTKITLIYHMIPLEEGDIFDVTRWEAGIEQLNRSGLFEPITPAHVVMKPDPVRGIVDVELRLTEADHRRIDFGGGVGTTGGASGNFDYSDISLTGRGDRLRTRVILGTREQSAAGQYSLSLISQRQPIIDLSAFFQRSVFVDATLPDGNREPLYLQRGAGVSAGLQFALSRTRYAIAAPTRAGIVYSFNSTLVEDRLFIAGSNIAAREERLRTASITTFLVNDTLDRPFDPQAGKRLVASVEVGGRALGGDFNTVKPSFDYRQFFALGRAEAGTHEEKSAIGLRVRASHIAEFGERFNSKTLSTIAGVPVFKRFFAGGEEEVRGYDLNSIAPIARVQRLVTLSMGEPMVISTEERPIGGDTEFILNAEYRLPLPWGFSAAAFFDLGASFNLRSLQRETFTATVPHPRLGTIDVTTVLSPATEPEFQLPKYRYSIGGELRRTIPVLNIPIRFIFAANPNAQTSPPPTLLIAPERKFFYGIGFSRTL